MPKRDSARYLGFSVDIFSSANAVSETGYIVNIDGNWNGLRSLWTEKVIYYRKEQVHPSWRGDGQGEECS